MRHCEDCGCATYRGLCVNCHEENYIEDQYLDLGTKVPENIYKKARENEAEVYLKPEPKNKKEAN